ILSPAETKRLFPPLSEDYGSVHVSGGARVNGRALRSSLINAAIKNGVVFHRGEASIVCENKRAVGIKLQDRLLSGEAILDTAGAWSRELLKPIGVEFLVEPQKAQIVHLEIPGADTSSWPVIMPPGNHYILTFESGRIVVGSTHENEAGFDTRVTAGGVHEILN
ncbi:FAD-dependent oxidoreductase, partial [Enterococcus faecium]|uniref:NAD(P)/FAD-dependent oxidoreductase n=1 Tax=Enterococcus faecium TaxID=1352 RepID=UPI0030C8B6D5